jgi:hypothetical protein
MDLDIDVINPFVTCQIHEFFKLHSIFTTDDIQVFLEHELLHRAQKLSGAILRISLVSSNMNFFIISISRSNKYGCFTLTMVNHNPGSIANGTITACGLALLCGALTTSSNSSLSDDESEYTFDQIIHISDMT